MSKELRMSENDFSPNRISTKKQKLYKRNQIEILELESTITKTIKHANKCIIGIPEGEEEKKGADIVF